MATIAILGTLDTKGAEHDHLAALVTARGHTALLIDVGTGSDATITPHITRHQVAAEAGIDLAEITARNDRGVAVTAMSTAAPKLLARLHREGKIEGVISLGGGGGTAIATAAMRALPIGFPKLMVSTLASGNVAPYVGNTDIVMMPAITDIAGLNRLSKLIFARAAGAICGMVEATPDSSSDKPLIVASMFGNTTACVTEAKRILEEAGYEVLVFAATGAGGRSMEAIIDSGIVAGVLDITTTELADELAGGVLTAGPDRLLSAARMNVPAVVAPGCLDMVNFGEPHTVSETFADRLFYHHNPQVTLMRTTPEECAKLGEELARKTNTYTAPVTLLIPRTAISVISAPRQPFHDPAADEALITAIQSHSQNPVIIHDLEINSPAFAQACAQALLNHLSEFRIQNS